MDRGYEQGYSKGGSQGSAIQSWLFLARDVARREVQPARRVDVSVGMAEVAFGFPG